MDELYGGEIAENLVRRREGSHAVLVLDYLYSGLWRQDDVCMCGACGSWVCVCRARKIESHCKQYAQR